MHWATRIYDTYLLTYLLTTYSRTAVNAHVHHTTIKIRTEFRNVGDAEYAMNRAAAVWSGCMS